MGKKSSAPPDQQDTSESETSAGSRRVAPTVVAHAEALVQFLADANAEEATLLSKLVRAQSAGPGHQARIVAQTVLRLEQHFKDFQRIRAAIEGVEDAGAEDANEEDRQFVLRVSSPEPEEEQSEGAEHQEGQSECEVPTRQKIKEESEPASTSEAVKDEPVDSEPNTGENQVERTSTSKDASSSIITNRPVVKIARLPSHLGAENSVLIPHNLLWDKGAKSITVDEEVRRLCDLSILNSQRQTVRSKREQRSNKNIGKKSKSESDMESSDNSGSLSESDKSVASDSKAQIMNPPQQLAEEEKFECTADDVLLPSSDEDRDESGEEKQERKKGSKTERTKKSGNESRKEDEPDFMKVSLADQKEDKKVTTESATKESTSVNGKEIGNSFEEDKEVSKSAKKKSAKARNGGIGEGKDKPEQGDFEMSENSPVNSDESDVEIDLKSKKLKRKRKIIDSSDEETQKSAKKKRARKAKGALKSSEDDENDDDSDSAADDKKGRKPIRKVMSDKKLSVSTTEAIREEKKRRERVKQKEEELKQLTKTTESAVVESVPLDFDSKTNMVTVEVNSRLAKRMKPHQARGIKFMYDAVFESTEALKEGKTPGGAILAHCMGLGKTLQSIGLVHTLMTNYEDHVKRVLILCPVNTVKNWHSEFGKWLPKGPDDDEIEVFEMSAERDNTIRYYKVAHWFKHGGAFIMGYDLFRNLTNETKKFKKDHKAMFQKALVDPGPDLVICDEGHVLKNLKSALNQALNRITTPRRIILTGTPLQNNLSEYYAMVNFVKPQLLGTYKEFKNRFVNPIQNGQHSDSTDSDVRLMKKRSFVLSDLLKGCMQRLDYNVLVPYLQPKFEYVLSINLTPFQKKLYKYFIENCASAGRIGLEGKLEGGKKGGLFYDVQMLNKIWNHPLILQRAQSKSFIDDEIAEEEDEDNAIEEEGTEEEEDIIETSCSDGSSSSSDNEDADSDTNEKATPKGRGRRATRSTKEELVAGIEEASAEAAKKKGWWVQFLEEDEDLEDIELGSKMVLLMDILKECETLGEKVLVFSQSLMSLDLIEAFLSTVSGDKSIHSEDSMRSYLGSWQSGRDYYRMDGSTDPATRQKWCNYFNHPNHNRMRLFLISTRAGGLGINLIAANRVIIFDASWNPAHDVQSIFRVYRFGQQKPVYIYRFLAKGTMEEKIYDRQVTKQSLSARVIDEHQIERHFSMNELAELYEFNDEPQENRPTPNVPKDVVLREMLDKHKDIIWKYHEHDSLLENLTEENLTEDERKAAWEEYENEKKGLARISNPLLQQSVHSAMSEIDPQAIQAQYRLQYPHLSEEQVMTATRAYVMQLQSAFTGKFAYDQSHYKQEMARAKMHEKALYPNLYKKQQSQQQQQALQYMRAGGSSQLQWQQQRQQQQQLQQQQELRRQMMEQQRLLEVARVRQEVQQQFKRLQATTNRTTAHEGGDDVRIEEVVINGSPVTRSPSSEPGTPSRRGRPRLDPNEDDVLTHSVDSASLSELRKKSLLEQ